MQSDQGECSGRIVHVHFALLALFDQSRRQGIHVDFQADGERSLWTHARADAAKFFTFDRPMKFQGVSPVGFIAEGVEPEYRPALFKHSGCVLTNALVGLICFYWGLSGL